MRKRGKLRNEKQTSGHPHDPLALSQRYPGELQALLQKLQVRKGIFWHPRAFDQ